MKWQSRKKQCEAIILYIQEKLFKLTNDDEISGLIIFLLHYHLVGFTWWYIAVGPVDFVFWLSVAFYAGLFITNEYFRGCILIKAERKLFGDKSWFGPWTCEENIDVSRVKILYKRWVITNIFLLIYRYTMLVRRPSFDVK